MAIKKEAVREYFHPCWLAFKISNLLSKGQYWSFNQHLKEPSQSVLAMRMDVEIIHSIGKQV